jgi:hypothetical protein
MLLGEPHAFLEERARRRVLLRRGILRTRARCECEHRDEQAGDGASERHGNGITNGVAMSPAVLM